MKILFKPVYDLVSNAYTHHVKCSCKLISDNLRRPFWLWHFTWLTRLLWREEPDKVASWSKFLVRNIRNFFRRSFWCFGASSKWLENFQLLFEQGAVTLICNKCVQAKTFISLPDDKQASHINDSLLSNVPFPLVASISWPLKLKLWNH